MDIAARAVLQTVAFVLNTLESVLFAHLSLHLQLMAHVFASLGLSL